jgi:hypothetical protein
LTQAILARISHPNKLPPAQEGRRSREEKEDAETEAAKTFGMGKSSGKHFVAPYREGRSLTPDRSDGSIAFSGQRPVRLGLLSDLRLPHLGPTTMQMFQGPGLADTGFASGDEDRLRAAIATVRTRPHREAGATTLDPSS